MCAQQSIEHGMQGMGLDGGNQRDSYTAKTNSQSNTASAAQPKKTTWASIASQPVKSSQTRIAATLKKKPGMPSHIKVPPPPMIPGKHNMDIGKILTNLCCAEVFHFNFFHSVILFRIGLDSEKNGALVPPPVPSPPPVIEPSPFQFPTKNETKASNNAGPAAANNSNADQAPQNRNDYRDDRGGNRSDGGMGGRDPMNRDMDRGNDWHRRGGDNDGGNAWNRRDNGYGGPMNNYRVKKELKIF